jgi:hypothetical protein
MQEITKHGKAYHHNPKRQTVYKTAQNSNRENIEAKRIGEHIMHHSHQR